MSARQDKFETKIIKLKKNVRALSPVLPVVRKLAGGSGIEKWTSLLAF